VKAAGGILLMVAATLVQVTWASQLEIAGAFPNLVLIAVVGVTWMQGVRAGLLWACAGGLLLDLNAPGPIGLHAVALLAGAYAAGFWARNLDREGFLHPMGAVACATILYSLVLIGADGVLGLPMPQLSTAVEVVVPACALNALFVPLLLGAIRLVTSGRRWEPAST
jgi:rod shape-determining protein MreD